MRYTDENVRFCLATPQAQYAPWRDDNGRDDFRTVSLSLCADPSGLLLYSAVMVKMRQPFNGEAWLELDGAGMAEKIEALRVRERPLHPYLLTATGARGRAVFAACFRPMTVPTECSLDMSSTEYVAEAALRRAAGWMPLSIESFGTEHDVRFCVVWSKNEEAVEWNAQATDDHDVIRQQRSEAMASIGASTVCLALTPSGHLARIFSDRRRTHSTAAYVGAGLTQEIHTQRAANRFPIAIAATAALATGVRYAVLFAESDEFRPLVHRTTGPEPLVLDDPNRRAAARIDDWVKTYQQRFRVRGMAVAIVEGTRLVYAKGFTYAEPAPHYPDVRPETLFRLASLSKLYCALVVWRALITRGRSPYTTAATINLQSVLHLRDADGNEPTNAFADVTVRHLLECNSGIDQHIVRGGTVYENADLTQGALPQPLTMLDITRAIAGAAFVGNSAGEVDANGKHVTRYGRTDYLLLGLVAAALERKSTFFDVLKDLVLDPLHLTRTRTSRSLVENRRPDDAWHHALGLECGHSAMHDNHRVVPIQYGHDNYEVYGGAGGLSAAVVDVARLAALLNVGATNPLHEEFAIATLIDSAVRGESESGGPEFHCFYGFDDAKAAGGVVSLSKGGDLAGAHCTLWGDVGGRFFVVLRNADAGDRSYKNDLPSLAQNVGWGGGDLFVDFDMPSL